MITECIFDESVAVTFSVEQLREANTLIQDFLQHPAECVVQGIDLPYRLILSWQNHKMILQFHSLQDPNQTLTHLISLSPYKAFLSEYAVIRQAYQESLVQGHSMQLETLDMARRGIHNQAAELLQERLQQKMTLDFGAARFLFSMKST